MKILLPVDADEASRRGRETSKPSVEEAPAAVVCPIRAACVLRFGGEDRRPW